MSTAFPETFDAHLRSYDREAWRRLLWDLLPGIHPVDQDATRIWFSFWPLQLRNVLEEAPDPQRKAMDLLLDGNWDLKSQLDDSVRFLYGSRYWREVKGAVREHARTRLGESPLLEQVEELAERLGRELATDPSLLRGMTAVAFMALRQVGIEGLQESGREDPPDLFRKCTPEEVLRSRQARSRRRLLDFLRTVDKRHRVWFDEQRREACFQAIHGQDLSMAAASDQRDYRSQDPRRVEGPIPFQCRIGSCGYCWVGILWGRERLAPISDYERQRLHYFGYDFGIGPEESHPPIRLACQSPCEGDVILVVPPWNGVLNLQRAEKWS